MDFDAPPLLEGKAQNQVDAVLDGYNRLRDKRRWELDFIRTSIELALDESNLLDRDKMMIEVLEYVKTL